MNARLSPLARIILTNHFLDAIAAAEEQQLERSRWRVGRELCRLTPRNPFRTHPGCQLYGYQAVAGSCMRKGSIDDQGQEARGDQKDIQHRQRLHSGAGAAGSRREQVGRGRLNPDSLGATLACHAISYLIFTPSFTQELAPNDIHKFVLLHNICSGLISDPFGMVPMLGTLRSPGSF